MHSNLCDVARKASFKCVVGDERPAGGLHPVALHPAVRLEPDFGHQVGLPAPHPDPRRSRRAPGSSSSIRTSPTPPPRPMSGLRIRPGTDGALALALAHVIIRDGLYDKDFVAEWTVGFDEYAAYVQGQDAGVGRGRSPGSRPRPSSGWPASWRRRNRRVSTSGAARASIRNGVQGGRAIAALAALVGGYDRPGTLMLAGQARGTSTSRSTRTRRPRRRCKQPRFDELEEVPARPQVRRLLPDVREPRRRQRSVPAEDAHVRLPEPDDVGAGERDGRQGPGEAGDAGGRSTPC